MNVRQTAKDMITDFKTAEPVTASTSGLRGLPLVVALLHNPRAVAFAVVACFFGGVIGMYIITRALNMFR